jgi:WD40 repeat protein
MPGGHVPYAHYRVHGGSNNRYSKASELVAFSCDDLSIRVIDLETRKLVREFWGCVGQVNDFIFSNDGRWIVAASMDSVVLARLAITKSSNGSHGVPV